MNPTSHDIFTAALNLPEDDRIRLAGDLLQSVIASGGDAERQAKWRQEIGRRWQELESGEVQAVPWSEVDRRLQQMLDNSGHA
ncbi:MAG: addiction module protein [Planctomycetales bacterium]|nr:addiction module protein [Planctomycetales bacterium]MBN8626670.1 addiction module protein [Planctomycetota bacterium]